MVKTKKSIKTETELSQSNLTGKLNIDSLETNRTMNLSEIRKSQQLSQQELANRLDLNQAEISKAERRTDMYLSTLKNYISAMGGQLDMIAVFPETGSIRISQFEQNDQTSQHSISSPKDVRKAEKSKTTEKPRTEDTDQNTENNILWLGTTRGAKRSSFNIPASADKRSKDENWFHKSLYQSV